MCVSQFWLLWLQSRGFDEQSWSQVENVLFRFPLCRCTRQDVIKTEWDSIKGQYKTHILLINCSYQEKKQQAVDHSMHAFCCPFFYIRGEHAVRDDHFTSSAVVMNAGVTQRCVLSSLFYSHFIHDCTEKYDRDHIIKFASSKTDRGNSR